MANLVIVAIPSEDDYVWKISSEKKPHMTLCFLGDVAGKPVSAIADFLLHATTFTELEPFMMDVDYRGTLGDDDADVLFFHKNWGYRKINAFREMILKDPNIRNAYDSVPNQYPVWTPHLTLGYPETPAKKDNRDNPGTRWVDFDRIALWYGDFEGPEWRLTYSYDFAEVSMSIEAGAAFVSHHGVKGMKWGQRKARTPPSAVEAQARSIVRNPKNAKTRVKTEGGHNHPATEDAIKAALAKQKLKKSGHAALTNKELQDLANRMNLETQVSSLLIKRPVRLATSSSPASKLIDKALRDPAKAVETGGKAVSETKRVAKRAQRLNNIRKGRR